MARVRFHALVALRAQNLAVVHQHFSGSRLCSGRLWRSYLETYTTAAASGTQTVEEQLQVTLPLWASQAAKSVPAAVSVATVGALW